MRIEHIDEVLPHIQGRDDFIVAVRDGYTVIDYVYQAPDTFNHPARLELRGIKFGPDGRVLARPFGKFFNINEKAHTQAGLLNLAEPHIIMEKLDGSMIHPAVVNGELVFMTRMGRTDVAKKAEQLLTPNLSAICRACLQDDGATPIFEYTAPTNRIVIKYDQSRLHLLAIRDNITGQYRDFGLIRPTAIRMGVDAVPFVPSTWGSIHEFVEFARVLQGKEGFVLRFESGLWVKMKGDDYVLKHTSKEATSREKNVLALILTQGLDDVIPLLSEDDAARIESYRAQVRAGIEATVRTVQHLVETGDILDQKAFAVEHLKDQPSFIRALAFSTRRSRDARKELQTAMLKHTNSQTQVDEIRQWFGAAWE